jgi:hypothetical protein
MWSKCSWVATAIAARSCVSGASSARTSPIPLPAFDDQIAVASPHVPDVRLEERVEVPLHEERDGGRDELNTEPAIGDGEVHQTRSVNETAAGDGRRQCTDTIEAL